jgi:hypothetical protein
MLTHRALLHAYASVNGAIAAQSLVRLNTNVIQRQSAHTGIAHPKDLLDRQRQIGESVRVNYSDSKGAFREFRERSKAQDRSR